MHQHLYPFLNTTIFPYPWDPTAPRPTVRNDEATPIGSPRGRTKREEALGLGPDMLTADTLTLGADAHIWVRLDGTS